MLTFNYSVNINKLLNLRKHLWHFNEFKKLFESWKCTQCALRVCSSVKTAQVSLMAFRTPTHSDLSAFNLMDRKSKHRKIPKIKKVLQTFREEKKQSKTKITAE